MEGRMGRKKKEALTQFNRNNILETAKKLFHEKGLTNTTMDDIAKHADYSKSTIYVYFKSKEEIYHYIIYDNMVHLRELLEKNIDLEKYSFEQCYFNICNAIVSFQNEYPLFIETMLSEISIDPIDHDENPVLKDIYQVGENINLIIIGFLKKGMEANYFDSQIDPNVTTHTLWASICGVIYLSDRKKDYIQMAMDLKREAFLHESFALLLKSITR
jgi:AcrR family transcriptional regulator